MPRSPHRAGHRYRVARAQMFKIYGRTCHLCGHGGAAEADHLVPISVDAGQPIDPHEMRPAHGSWRRCPTCDRACNQERGTKPLSEVVTPVLTW